MGIKIWLVGAGKKQMHCFLTEICHDLSMFFFPGGEAGLADHQKSCWRFHMFEIIAMLANCGIEYTVSAQPS